MLLNNKRSWGSDHLGSTPGYDLGEGMARKGIETNMILLQIKTRLKSALQLLVLRLLQLTLKDAVLNPSAIAFQQIRDFLATFVAGDVVGDDIELHLSPPQRIMKGV
jgi:hypothetical protein